MEGSEVIFHLDEVATHSLLVRYCLERPQETETVGAYAVQFLQHFVRGPVQIAQGDWVMVSISGTNVVGYASEIALIYANGESVVRMLLTNEWEVELDNEQLGGMIVVDAEHTKHLSTHGLPISLEYASLTPLALDPACCLDSGTKLMRFSYEF